LKKLKKGETLLPKGNVGCVISYANLGGAVMVRPYVANEMVKRGIITPTEGDFGKFIARDHSEFWDVMKMLYGGR